MMKKLIATATISLTTLFGAAFAQDATAVVFWAEWCGACKVLDPTLDKAAASYENGEIEIFRFDYSNASDMSTIMAQVDAAEKRGVSQFIELGAIKTGFAKIIVDGEEKTRITAGMSEEMMHDRFDLALGK